MASSFNTTVLDAPDQRLREIYLRAQYGKGGLSDSDIKRLAQRQGVEAGNLAAGGVNMNFGSARDLKGKLKPDSYEYAGKPTPSEKAAKEASAVVNKELSNQQDTKEQELTEKEKNLGLDNPANPKTTPPVEKPNKPTGKTVASTMFDGLGTSDFLNPTESLDDRLRRRRVGAYTSYSNIA
jgi:hypothetical protein